VTVPLYAAKAEFFRTLGHPARIRVLELLSDGDRPVHELLAAIAIEPSNLSQQLSVLRMAGLVVQRREGTEVIYSLALPEVRDLLLAARHILETKHATPGALVDEVSRRPVAP
jgi:ArsR family transcriptional regulator